jgi:hypothetical protein
LFQGFGVARVLPKAGGPVELFAVAKPFGQFVHDRGQIFVAGVEKEVRPFPGCQISARNKRVRPVSHVALVAVHQASFLIGVLKKGSGPSRMVKISRNIDFSRRSDPFF